MYVTTELDADEINPDAVTIDNDTGAEVEALPEPAKPISKLGKERQFRVLQSHWRADADHSRAWRANYRYWQAFRAGEQWGEEDKALLADQERPTIVFNRVLTILKAVAGMEINGRHEISFLPRGTEDTKPNELLSSASKWMADSCDGEDEESTAFDNCATGGMGFVEERMSWEDDPAGLYVEECVDPTEMYWDRTCKKKNLTKARRMFRVRRMPYSEASMLFPGKTRDQIDAGWASDFTGEYPLLSIEEKRDRSRENDDYEYDDTCEVTIVHAQWTEHEVYWIIADPQTNSKIEMEDDEYQVLMTRMKRLGVKLTAARMVRKVYKQAWLGGEMLEPAGPAPIKGQFSWKCITGELDTKSGTWFGLVKVMRDPQMWANKWLSQILHILNSTAKGGIIAELDAFDDEEQAEESYARSDTITWAASGALTGQNGSKIMPKPGAGVVDGYVGIMTFAISSIKDVTGINLELLGQQDQNQPGILEAMRKQAGMTVLATLFDSLRRFRKQVGRSRLFFIQNFLSDGRMIRVTGVDDVKAVRLALDQTTGEYDVIVDDTPTSPNQKEQNWAIIQPMLAIFKEQLIANPEIFAILLEYSPLPSRIVEAVKTMIQQQQQNPQKQQEDAENRQMLMATTQAQVELAKAQAMRAQSAAMLDQARVPGLKADALQSVASARNMLEDNQNNERMAYLDAATAEAKMLEAQAKALLAKVQAAREQSGADLDAVDLQIRQQAASAAESDGRVARLIEMMGARSQEGVDRSNEVKNLALAKKALADASRPRPAPAGAGR